MIATPANTLNASYKHTKRLNTILWLSIFIKYKDESSDVIYSKINDNYKIFLKNYKIKNKIYLKRIVRNVVSKKVKILAL